MSLLPYPKRSPKTISQESTILVSDAQLLSQFLKLKNEEAFAAIVNRYGSMVFAVAVRIVRDRHIAEDVTQATFLLLAKDAKKIKRREALSSWLHGVAIRLAKKSMKRRSREQVYNVVTDQEVAEKSFEEIHSTFEQQVLDEELNRLPTQYRDPLVLHYLQGKTYEETAQQLGVTLGAIEGRMKRGKRELQLRLTKRGVSLGAVVAALSWSQAEAAVSLQPEIIHTIAENGIAAFQGTAFTPACSPEAVFLAGKELTMLTTTKIALMTLALSVAAGTGWVTHSGLAQEGRGRAAAENSAVIQTQVDDLGSPASNRGVSNSDEGGDNPLSQGSGFESVLSEGDRIISIGSSDSTQADLATELNSLRKQLNALANSQSDPFAARDEEKFQAQIRKLQADLARLTKLNREADMDLSEYGGEGMEGMMENMGGDMMSGMGMEMSGVSSGSTIKVEKNQSPATEKIVAALDSLNKPIDFIEQPISDAIEYISEVYEIPTIIDEQELENEGLSLDEPITFEMDADTIPTQDALELMLEKLDLKYIIKNGVLIVTTEVGATEHSETRVYDVRPLNIEDPEALTDVLLHTVAPDSWAILGGMGEVSFLNGSLVVIQSQEVHEKIEVLLNQLAKQVEANSNNPNWPPKKRPAQGGEMGYGGGGFMGSGFMGGGMEGGGGR